MTKDRMTDRGRAALAAAAVVGGLLMAVGSAAGPAQATPFAPAPTGTLTAENGVIAVRHGWGGHHGGWGRHRGWGHRHWGWHRGHHWGWGRRHRGWRHRW